jgi:hypothetical protein
VARVTEITPLAARSGKPPMVGSGVEGTASPGGRVAMLEGM